LESKQIYAVPRPLRCYYRSLFDVMDTKQEGVVAYKSIHEMLENTFRDKAVNAADPKVPKLPEIQPKKGSKGKRKGKGKPKSAGAGSKGKGSKGKSKGKGSALVPAAPPDPVPASEKLLDWFKDIDKDKKGAWTYPEFLHGVMGWVGEQEKLKRKLVRKGRRRSPKKPGAKRSPVRARSSSPSAAKAKPKTKSKKRAKTPQPVVDPRIATVQMRVFSSQGAAAPPIAIAIPLPGGGAVGPPSPLPSATRPSPVDRSGSTPFPFDRPSSIPGMERSGSGVERPISVLAHAGAASLARSGSVDE